MRRTSIMVTSAWLPARVVRKLGNVIYEVELETFGKRTRHHLNQLQPRSASVSPEWDDGYPPLSSAIADKSIESDRPSSTVQEPIEPRSPYSRQVRRPPDRLGVFVN